MRQQLDTAIRLSLAGQVRNRFAWILLVAFVPAVVLSLAEDGLLGLDEPVDRLRLLKLELRLK